jgi:hypothetical protein
MERERGLRERAHGKRDEREFVVVAGNAVRAQLAAGAAAMDDGPIAARPRPNGYRLHRALTF